MTGLQRFRGFRLLAWAWGLLAWWNFDAIVGHWAEWTLTNPVIMGQGFWPSDPHVRRPDLDFLH